MRSELLDEAAKLSSRVDSELMKPGALLLPAGARQAIRDLASVVFKLAAEVEKCRTKTPSL